MMAYAGDDYFVIVWPFEMDLQVIQWFIEMFEEETSEEVRDGIRQRVGVGRYDT